MTFAWHKIRLLILFFLFFGMLPGLTAQERTIQIGDVLEIVVFEHSELSRKVVVDETGTVNFPFLEGLPVEGLTTTKVQELISLQLSRRIGQRPIVVVVFGSESDEIMVTVLGAVKQPGAHLIRAAGSLQGAVAAAGGFLPGAKLDSIEVRAQGNGATSYNLEHIMATGELSNLPELNMGDIVVVPGAFGSKQVKILGAVRRPGEYMLYGKHGILDLLALAGGPLDKADLNQSYLVSPRANENSNIDLDINNMLKNGGQLNLPELQDGDLIYITPKTSGIWPATLRFVRDVTTLASLVYIILRIRE